jgi:hypothetical protein
VRAAAEKGEGVGVGGQEVLHGLRDGELQVHHAAVAQHHHKEAQAAGGITNMDRAELAPVDLGAIAGSEGQRQEGRRLGRADLVDVVLDDADAAAVAAFTQTLEDLGGRIRMGFEPADNLLFIGIELAGTRRSLSRAELVGGQPPGDGLGMQMQLAGDLPGRQMAVVMVVADLAVQFVVNHEAPLS